MYSDIFKQVAEELNLPLEVVKLAYKSQWEFIRESIKKLPLKQELNEEEFSKLRTNFNVPSIGKLSCTYKRYQGVKKQFKVFKELQNVQNKSN